MEYKYELYSLNKLCEFKNRQTESDFMEYEKSASLKTVRILMFIMGLTFSMFAVTDYYYYVGKGASFFISLGLRGTTMLITIISIFLVGKVTRYNRTLLLVTLVELIVFAIFLLIIYNQKGREPVLTFMTMMLFILTVFLIPNVFKNCLIAGCIIVTGYIIFCVFFGPPDERPPLVQRGIYLGICLVSCAIFLFGRESSRRSQYATEKHLEFMSITDRLTGIYNRGRFDHVLSLWIKNMRHDPFCLLLFDIDDFKLVNDRFGHTGGDQVLVSTTAMVTSNIRDDDIFARWGGEEFVILFGNTTIERAVELAERLRKAVENNICGEAGNITISIGVVQYRRGETSTEGESVIDVVRRVDEKMYEAKQAGKNRVIAEY